MIHRIIIYRYTQYPFPFHFSFQSHSHEYLFYPDTERETDIYLKQKKRI